MALSKKKKRNIIIAVIILLIAVYFYLKKSNKKVGITAIDDKLFNNGTVEVSEGAGKTEVILTDTSPEPTTEAAQLKPATTKDGISLEGLNAETNRV